MVAQARSGALGAVADAIGFTQSSEESVGRLLRALVAMRPDGRYLELGTGVGQGTNWLVSSMTEHGHLVTVELEQDLQAAARDALGDDERISWALGDGSGWLRDAVTRSEEFDGVFADTWPGKFHDRDLALQLVKPGGWYLVDDLLPQPSWPDGHQEQVDRLMTELSGMAGWTCEYLALGSGVMFCVRG